MANDVGGLMAAAATPEALGRTRRYTWRSTVQIGLIAGLTTFAVGSSLMFAWSWVRFGTPSAGANFFRGEPLLVEPDFIDLGIVPSGADLRVSLNVSNLSEQLLTVQGLAGMCGQDGCVESVDTFPLTIAPLTARRVTLKVRSPIASERSMRLESELYTSHGIRQFTVICTSSPTFETIETTEGRP
jgi:hypothetical protein